MDSLSLSPLDLVFPLSFWCLYCCLVLFLSLLSGAFAYGTTTDGLVSFLLGTEGVKAAFLELRATPFVSLVISSAFSPFAQVWKLVF
jgi:hypothetical protein